MTPHISELKQFALEAAIRTSSGHDSPGAVVARAEKYLAFLQDPDKEQKGRRV